MHNFQTNTSEKIAKIEIVQNLSHGPNAALKMSV
jgi:hypothetical protein